jgi:hypothetical protein
MNDQFLVPRLEDLPYATSPAVEFVYKQTAALAAGSYIFSGSVPSPLSVLRPLMQNCVYYFRSLTISADIEENDYLPSITVTPTFQMFLKGTGKQILFREPVSIAKYFQNFDYRLCWITQREDDELFGVISGTLTQTASLIGKASITVSVVISAQEIVDQAFVKRFFNSSYPQVG